MRLSSSPLEMSHTFPWCCQCLQHQTGLTWSKGNTTHIHLINFVFFFFFFYWFVNLLIVTPTDKQEFFYQNVPWKNKYVNFHRAVFSSQEVWLQPLEKWCIPSSCSWWLSGDNAVAPEKRLEGLTVPQLGPHVVPDQKWRITSIRYTYFTLSGIWLNLGLKMFQDTTYRYEQLTHLNHQATFCILWQKLLFRNSVPLSFSFTSTNQ